MTEYTSVTKPSVFRFEDRKSVFIGQVFPIETEEEAMARIAEVRKTYPDAKHHVYAYVCRQGDVYRFSDDHEPSGTAGKPILDILLKKEYTNTLVVITRYFGGILLGTGGLVHAYTEAAVGALAEAQISVFSLYSIVSFSLSYTEYQRFASMASAAGFRTENANFDEKVYIRGSIKAENYADFCEKISMLTSGNSIVEEIEKIFSK